MQIYLTHSSNFDYENELYLPIKESDLYEEHDLFLPHEESNMAFSSVEFIKTCQVILAEVSYPSTGQGIELGWANLHKLPIICFHKSGQKYSNALETICENIFEYKNENEMIKKISENLAQLF